jgi:FdhD protein
MIHVASDLRMVDMDKSNQQIPGVKYVQAQRISTAGTPRPAEAENVCVAHEAPVTLDVEGVETYTLLCTPIDRLALAAGFLVGEGLVERPADIKTLKVCDDDPNTIRIRLTDSVPKIQDSGRNLLIVSSCGQCGSENLQKRIDALPAVGNSLRIEPGLLRAVNKTLNESQGLFEISGGTHAAAIFDETGQILSAAEDTGRHNALDKAIGKCFLAGQKTSGRGAVLTSRLSLEMVGRCARAGIELIAAVSAPTSLAIEVAQSCNITLCAFVRDTRATVFSHPARLAASESI